jgi:hypothetical protein
LREASLPTQRDSPFPSSKPYVTLVAPEASNANFPTVLQAYLSHYLSARASFQITNFPS